MIETLPLEDMAHSTVWFRNGHMIRHSTIDDGDGHYKVVGDRLYVHIAHHISHPRERIRQEWRDLGMAREVDWERCTVDPWLSIAT